MTPGLDPARLVGRRLRELVEVELRLGLEHVGARHGGALLAAREQRAGVVGGAARTATGSRATAAFAITSRLSHASSGRSTGSSDASSTEVMFGSVCDETWPSESPVTSAAAPQPLARARSRRAPSGGGRARSGATPRETADSMRCWLPNGTTHSAPGRAAWKPFSTRACACAFVGRERVEVRLAAEVEELDREPALHREQRRDRRVDAARTAARPRGRWCRPAARPRPRARARARRRRRASSSTRSSRSGPAEVDRQRRCAPGSRRRSGARAAAR